MCKKKALIFSHLFNDCSGSPRVLRDAIEVARKNLSNTQLFLVTSQHSGFLTASPVDKMLTAKYTRSTNKLIQLFYLLLSQVNTFFIVIRLIKKLRREYTEPTLVVNTMLPFGSGLAAKICGVKCIYYIHESTLKPLLYKKFLRAVIKVCCNETIYVSKYLKREEQFSNLPGTVIYNGLRRDFEFDVKIDPLQKFSNRNVLFAGSLKDYKGIYQFLELAKLMPDFNFIAALNCNKSDLDEFLLVNCTPTNCTLQARPANLQELFIESTFVVNLSLPELWTETFGLSLLEGLASSSPVIAPVVGGHTEFVTKDNGKLVDAREFVVIADFIRCVGDDYDKWKAYSDSAFLTSSYFDYQVFSNRIIEFFNERGFS